MIFPSTRFFNYIGPSSSEMISPPPLPLCSSWLPLSRILLFMTLLSVPLNSLSTPLPSLSASHPKSIHFSNSLDFSEGDPPDCDGGSKSRYHALVCWLWNAHITLPDEQFREGIFTIVRMKSFLVTYLCRFDVYDPSLFPVSDILSIIRIQLPRTLMI